MRTWYNEVKKTKSQVNEKKVCKKKHEERAEQEAKTKCTNEHWYCIRFDPFSKITFSFSTIFTLHKSSNDRQKLHKRNTVANVK